MKLLPSVPEALNRSIKAGLIRELYQQKAITAAQFARLMESLRQQGKG